MAQVNTQSIPRRQQFSLLVDKKKDNKRGRQVQQMSRTGSHSAT